MIRSLAARKGELDLKYILDNLTKQVRGGLGEGSRWPPGQAPPQLRVPSGSTQVESRYMALGKDGKLGSTWTSYRKLGNCTCGRTPRTQNLAHRENNELLI